MMMNKNYDGLAEKALSYYYAHRRFLPWRENPTPYHVWISEIMLQQTRVDTVIPYFNRFIENFPTIMDLANAPEDKLLKLWEGLGYYSRARNLQKAAKVLLDNYDASLPSDKSELMKLPGIGAYTAGAISSIAFGKSETAVDGNLIRIGSRLMAYRDSVSNAQGKKVMENFWLHLLPEKHAGDFNQAMMDLGATICLPNSEPLCLLCPIREYCLAFELGNPTDFPKKEIKKPRRIEEKTVFLLRFEEKILLQKRENGGLLGGLLQFPMADEHLQENDALSFLQNRGLVPIRIKAGVHAKHIFSHIEWRMISWEVVLDPFVVMENPKNDFDNSIWVEQTQLDEITLPTAFRKFRKRAAERF
ncbi:MAG: A/G-specific adenine glycosylase [Peptostreptococcaceae bacterium]|nr:A/G-specific adenine glycosylase [Peptostreptococcaceae bacterium]